MNPYQHVRPRIRIPSLFTRRGLLLVLVLLFLFPAPVSSVHAATPALSKKKLTLYTGEQLHLKARFFSGKVKWSSSSRQTATASGGLVVAKKAGSAMVTALHGMETATCLVTVRNTELSSSRLTIRRSALKKLKLRCSGLEKVKWSTSNSSVVRLIGQGSPSVTLYGNKTGTAVVTAAYLGKTYTCFVTVADEAQKESSPGEAEETPLPDPAELHPLFGKKIAVYGSSNEVGSYNESGISWVDLMKDELTGIATVVNKSVGGNTLARSVERMAADKNLSTYDIILVTTARNTYRQSLTLPGETDPRGFLESLYTLYGLIDREKQTVYLASCLPFATPVNSLSNVISVYDGLIYKTCQKLGFKYLDMHSWAGFAGEDSYLYTRDGAHLYLPIHEKLAACCLTALSKGGEALKPYTAKVTGDDLLKLIRLNTTFVELADAYKSYNYYSVDTELNVSLCLWLTAKKTIPAGEQILGPAPKTSFYPMGTCLYGISSWGVCRMYTDGHVVKDNEVTKGSTFVVQISSRSLLDAGI